ncbi:glycosyltransferase family 4 protein [Alteromonas sp. H39]|uniref:glycosyltransferase family 4 protein n=1 Tax=Alteromonas sp. H39 TaxID=3389876 RepID=UPI0039E15B50
MKVCAIGLRGIPNVMGGIESHCQQLYPRMVKSGDNVTVIARSPYVEKKHDTFEGVEIIALWTIRHKLIETFLHTFLALLYARFVVKPDVLHIHAIGPALFTPLAKLLGMTVVVTHHGADYDRQKWNRFAKKLLRTGESMAVRFADSIVVVGSTLTEKLRHQYPSHKGKISYVPNGTLTNFDDTLTPEALPSDLDIVPDNYIVTVGRLVPEKGFHDLIAAYEDSRSELKLVIVGNADHEDDYSRNLLRHRSDNVIFAGRRQGDELNALYKFARVFVLPSYHEGLPIVALEAISAGTDVMLSDITPNADIGLPEDCYFPVGDTDSLAKKFNQLNQLRLGINKTAFLSKFNWDTIAEDTRQVLTCAMKKKSAEQASHS